MSRTQQATALNSGPPLIYYIIYQFEFNKRAQQPCPNVVLGDLKTEESLSL